VDLGEALTVSTKIRALQSTGLCSGDVKGGLEFGVEHVQETVGEAPEEEQNGDQADWQDRLPYRQS
jgi:hypothetical protein